MDQKNNNKSSLEIELDCSLSRFTNNDIPEEQAICWLNYLIELTGKKFTFDITTNDVFSGTKEGKESGEIDIQKKDLRDEKEKFVEYGAICLSFLFFSNKLNTSKWFPTPRRGEHWDFWCLNSNNEKIVIEVGGSTSEYGAQRDQSEKKDRFGDSTKIKEKIYISSVGFKDGDHIVSKYN